MSRSKNELLLIAFALLFGSLLICAVCLNTLVPERAGDISTPIEHGGGLNINTACADELSSLEGIGSTKAEKIVEYRSEHGEFICPEEITNVDGIGEKTYEKIKDRISAY